MSRVPQRLEGYRLTRFIRAEAPTEIWQATHLDHPLGCALKILSPRFRDNHQLVKQLRHEQRVAISLDHPQVLRVFDFHTVANISFIVLEAFPSQSLRQLLQEKQRERLLNDLPSIVSQVASGLGHLHGRGWVHTCVKPANLLLNEQLELKLIDFALARRFPQGKFKFWVSKHRLAGVPTYMSPEQIRGQALDPRSDIYSLGCVLFELTEGRPPYTGSSQKELLNKHLTAKVPRITASAKHITPTFVELIAAMMAKSAEHRPDNMLHLLQAFQHSFRETQSLEFTNYQGIVFSDSNNDHSSGDSISSRVSPQLPTLAKRLQNSTARLAGLRWLQITTVMCLLAMSVWFWWFPENDQEEQQVLGRFKRLVVAIEQPPEFATQVARAQYWHELDTSVQAAVSAHERLPPGTATRPDLLELGWSASLLPRAMQERTASANQRPILAIVNNHLRNAEGYLQRRAEEREARSITFAKVANSNSLFWAITLVDLFGAAFVIRLFMQSKQVTR